MADTRENVIADARTHYCADCGELLKRSGKKTFTNGFTCMHCKGDYCDGCVGDACMHCGEEYCKQAEFPTCVGDDGYCSDENIVDCPQCKKQNPKMAYLLQKYCMDHIRDCNGCGKKNLTPENSEWCCNCEDFACSDCNMMDDTNDSYCIKCGIERMKVLGWKIGSNIGYVKRKEETG